MGLRPTLDSARSSTRKKRASAPERRVAEARRPLRPATQSPARGRTPPRLHAGSPQRLTAGGRSRPGTGNPRADPLSKTEDKIANLSSVFGRGPPPHRQPPTSHPPGVGRLARPACWRGADAPSPPGEWQTGVRDDVPGTPTLPRPPARFSPVLEQAGSRVTRRVIAEGDAQRQRSALDADRGSTTLTKKRAAPRPLLQHTAPPAYDSRPRPHRSPGR